MSALRDAGVRSNRLPLTTPWKNPRDVVALVLLQRQPRVFRTACRQLSGVPMLRRTACALPVSFLLATSDATASDAVDFAARLVGRPYVWGAEGPDAFDCSGLTQYVFQEFGVDLPRRAVDQSAFGDPTRRLQRGDLVFFSSDTRRSLVTHVGIYEGGGTMIDASKRHGRVRRDDLNDSYWSARFMAARRVTEDIEARAGGRGDRSGDRARRPTERREDGRREAARVLGQIADLLLRRAGRR